MQHLNRIDVIDARRKRLNLALPALCRAVGEDPSQLYRWTHGANGRVVNPKVFTVDRTLSNIENELDHREAAIFFALAPKFLPADILATLNLPSPEAERAPADIQQMEAAE